MHTTTVFCLAKKRVTSQRLVSVKDTWIQFNNRSRNIFFCFVWSELCFGGFNVIFLCLRCTLQFERYRFFRVSRAGPRSNGQLLGRRSGAEGPTQRELDDFRDRYPIDSRAYGVSWPRKRTQGQVLGGWWMWGLIWVVWDEFGRTFVIQQFRFGVFVGG